MISLRNSSAGLIDKRAKKKLVVPPTLRDACGLGRTNKKTNGWRKNTFPNLEDLS